MTDEEWEKALFQSYQFMQINPDVKVEFVTKKELLGFNRINSCRSIPTSHSFPIAILSLTLFQSYQFMQINPDRKKAVNWSAITKRFQSYQFMQINPD